MLKKDLLKMQSIDKKLDKLIDKIPEHPFLNMMSTHLDFALREVRTNGRGKRVSYPDIKNDFRTIMDDYEKIVLTMPEIRKYIDELEKELNNYMICPKCKGKQIFNTHYHMHEDTQECDKCDGHGVIRQF